MDTLRQIAVITAGGFLAVFLAAAAVQFILLPLNQDVVDTLAVVRAWR